MDTEEQWICPTCSSFITMPHCAACGERKPHPQELTLTGICKQAFEAFTSYDSRLLATFRTLLFQPGGLTVKYLQGSRKPFLGPFALFLLANVLFVALEALTAGSNVLATTLDSHLHRQPWDVSFAQPLVAAKLEQSGRTLETYTPVFDGAVALNAKSFVFLMVLPFALLPALLFARRKQPFAAHLAYSLHFHAFLLMAFCVMLVVIDLSVALGGPGLASERFDKVLSIVLLVMCATYLHLSSGKVYKTSGIVHAAQTLVMTSAAMAIFFGYRFGLFLYTLYTT